jgi:hypothetical protein
MEAPLATAAVNIITTTTTIVRIQALRSTEPNKAHVDDKARIANLGSFGLCAHGTAKVQATGCRCFS